jgi:hypothetical protein
MEVLNAQLAKKTKEVVTAQSFSENISKLMASRNVSCGDDLSTEFFTDKVAINVDMLRSFVKNGVGSNVKGCLIVTKEFHGLRMRNPERLKKHLEPKELTSGCCHSSIFSFSRRTGNRVLLLGSP